MSAVNHIILPGFIIRGMPFLLLVFRERGRREGGRDIDIDVRVK